MLRVSDLNFEIKLELRLQLAHQFGRIDVPNADVLIIFDRFSHSFAPVGGFVSEGQGCDLQDI